MKKSSTVVLKATLLLIGIFMVVVCSVGIPHTIGSFSLDGYDPILLGLYIPVVPFFFALYQAKKLLDYIEQNNAFSIPSVKAFRTIKICAATISALFMLGLPYIFYVAEKDDAPGVVLLTGVIIFTSFVIATFAAVLQRLIQHAVDIKAENDLTV